jgi:hypothetical protein
LNLLTPDVIKEASKEIQIGKSIQLDWPLHNIEYPTFGRFPCQHKIKDLAEEGFVAFDDEITLNTQTSSQWDGLKHVSSIINYFASTLTLLQWGIQKSKLYYNGLKHEDALKQTTLGTHNICDRGGIVGRAILVDWLRWWEERNPGQDAPSPISTYGVPISDIEKVLAYQGTVCKQGDIFIMRTGFTRWHDNASKEARIHGTHEHPINLIGIANNEETVKWLYSKHFSAVAGDTQGFEAWPFPEDCCLHEWLLCHWGTPIGELWDLEILSKECFELKRWSFFFTSAPLRVVGGIASPPNALAIF